MSSTNTPKEWKRQSSPGFEVISESPSARFLEFPRPGSWTIAFQTGTPAAAVAPYLPGDHVSVYVPTTPNPTGGYFLMLPRTQVRELDMTVDEALKYIISMGVVAPRVQAHRARGELPGAGGEPAPATGSPSEIRN